MEPLSALSLASAVIQIVEFSSKVISRTREISTSADGTFEDASQLEDVTTNLSDLMEELGRKYHTNYQRSSVPSQKIADEQLVELAKDSQTVAKILHATLDRVKHKKDGGERTAFFQAFRSIREQKKISGLANKLDQIREQVHTALLVSLHQQSLACTTGLGKDTPLPKDDALRQKAELLSSLQDHNWQHDDLTKFSHAFMSSVVDRDVETRFFDLMIAQLYFSDLPNRYETIPKAHQDTFQWIFEDDAQQRKPDDWDSFTDWLAGTDGNNLYWITGKPGSGKSTLMKYLFNDDRTSTNLKAWTEGSPLVEAGFFFWNSGTAMQMSRMGLLQSILHTALKGDKQTLLQLFKDRWQQFVAFGGGRQPFTWYELRQAFDLMISAPLTPRKFFLVIDGLDEFDGEPKELVDLVLDTAKHPHVKVCAASRPWLVFSDAFEGKPNLLLERLTKKDIHNYITSSFASNKHYGMLSKLEADRATSLIKDIADKAAGVFLWVYLVVQSLLDGFSNADRVSDLVMRLEALPPGLEQLFDKLLGSLDANYYKHACQLFRLVMSSHNPPSLLELWFADNEDTDSAMKDEVRFLTENEITDRLETMNRRLISRCKGFLEVEWPDPNARHSTPNAVLSQTSRVNWIHRTARDFLLFEAMWNNILDTTGYDAFDPEHHWANAHMRHFKGVSEGHHLMWLRFLWCVEYALRLEFRLKICPVEYLDEVGRTAMINCEEYRTPQDIEPRAGEEVPAIETFLDWAVFFNLASYVRIKGPQVPRDEILHAAQFKYLQGRHIFDVGTKLLNTASMGETTIYQNDSSGPMIVKKEGKSVDFPFNQKKLDEALSSALRYHKKGYRKARWERTKRRFLGRLGSSSFANISHDAIAYSSDCNPSEVQPEFRRSTTPDTHLQPSLSSFFFIMDGSYVPMSAAM